MRPSLLSLMLMLAAGAAHSQDSTAAELARFQGLWLMVGSSANGQQVEILPEGIREVSGDTVTVTIDGRLMMEGTFRFDPTTTPKSIDYVVLAGPVKGSRVPGVYKFDDGRLTICVGGPDGTRPTDFVAETGEAGWCSVWERK